MKIEVSTKELAKFFGITTRAITKWHASGCPRIKRGKWDLKVVFDWWWEHMAQSRAVEEAGDESINEAKRLYWWEKAKGEELKNSKLNGTLASWDDIEAEWCARLLAVTSGLGTLEHRLPPLIEGKGRRDVQLIIHNEIKYLRDSYARRGKYCPTPKAKKKKS